MSEDTHSGANVDLIQTVARLEEKIEGMFKRMDEQQRLSAIIYENSSSYKLLTERIEHVLTCQGNMRQEIDELRLKPGKRWDNVIDRVITALVSAAVGFLFARISGN